MCIDVVNVYIEVGSVVYCLCGIDCVWVLGRGFMMGCIIVYDVQCGPRVGACM